MFHKYSSWFCIPIYIFVVHLTASQEIDRKICSTSPNDSACQQIARNLEVACNYNLHSVDCLLNIQNNRSHLGRITGEEALLGANLLNETVVVIGEIKTRHPPSQTVVIVKNEVPNGFLSLKGRKFCHPGFKHDSSFSNSLLQEFENKVIELNNIECNDNISLVERHVKALSDFFGKSCRPGPWIQQDRMNGKLQKKYSSLCELCEGQTCNVANLAPFNDSMKCLVNSDADVAVTTFSEAQRFFLSTSNQQNYKYLCKDGYTKSFSTPCIWSSKLPNLLVAERSLARSIESYLLKNLSSKINKTKSVVKISKQTAEEALISILHLERQEQIFLQTDFKSLKQYIKDPVPTPEETEQCNRAIKWCTYADSEQQKCKWLSQAAVNWGIQPVVNCVRSDGNDELSCLDDIKKHTADIVVASSDYAYISLNKGLTSIAFPETDTRNLSVILAIKRDSDNSITTFEELRGKGACIPQFGGKEHLALVDTTRRLGITDDESCDYGKVLNDFIGDSCVPGVLSSLIKESTDCVDKDKMCKQCQAVNVTRTSNYCNADAVNKYFGSKGAVDCLLDKKGDFAIITNITDIENATDVRVICKNNTLSATRGLNVDINCALFVVASSEVVTASDNPIKQDIKLALREFEKWFGQNLKKEFHLFDRFNGEPDLLFLDSTPGLNFENDLDYIKTYKDLLRNVKHCNTGTGGSSAIKMSLLLFIPILILFLSNFNILF